MIEKILIANRGKLFCGFVELPIKFGFPSTFFFKTIGKKYSSLTLVPLFRECNAPHSNPGNDGGLFVGSPA